MDKNNSATCCCICLQMSLYSSAEWGLFSGQSFLSTAVRYSFLQNTKMTTDHSRERGNCK